MKKCICSKRIIAFYYVIIFLITFMLPIGLLINVLLIQENRMNSYILVNALGEAYGKPFLRDDRIFAVQSAIVLLGTGCSLIYDCHKKKKQYILFDEEKVIFLLSKDDHREFRWSEIQPNRMHMEWLSVPFKSNFIKFTFPEKGQVELIKRNKNEAVSTVICMKRLRNLFFKRNIKYKLPSGYKNFKELVWHFHKNGILEQFGME